MFRDILNDDERKQYDSMMEFFIEHHYDEDKYIDDLMYEWSEKKFPIKLAQYMRELVVIEHKLSAKQRVELEAIELANKIHKLTDFTVSEKYYDLSYDAKLLLLQQKIAMNEYLQYLTNRLNIWEDNVNVDNATNN